MIPGPSSPSLFVFQHPHVLVIVTCPALGAWLHLINRNTLIWVQYPRSPWSGTSWPELVQIEHVLGSPWVGYAFPVARLGDHRRSWPARAASVMNDEHTVARDVCGEEIEMWGCFCKSSVTHKNSNRTHLQLIKTSRAFLRCFHCGRGRSPVPCVAGSSGLKSAQYYSLVSLFLFIPELKQF
jgi:hypothetical protein